MGLMFGYLWYLLIHDVVYRRHPKHGSPSYRAKIHHARHHYAKVPGLIQAIWQTPAGVIAAFLWASASDAPTSANGTVRPHSGPSSESRPERANDVSS